MRHAVYKINECGLNCPRFIPNNAKNRDPDIDTRYNDVCNKRGWKILKMDKESKFPKWCPLHGNLKKAKEHEENIKISYKNSHFNFF